MTTDERFDRLAIAALDHPEQLASLTVSELWQVASWAEATGDAILEDGSDDDAGNTYLSARTAIWTIIAEREAN